MFVLLFLPSPHSSPCPLFSHFLVLILRILFPRSLLASFTSTHSFFLFFAFLTFSASALAAKRDAFNKLAEDGDGPPSSSLPSFIVSCQI